MRLESDLLRSAATITGLIAVMVIAGSVIAQDKKGRQSGGVLVELTSDKQLQILEKHLKAGHADQYRLTLNQNGKISTKGSLPLSQVTAIKSRATSLGGGSVAAVHESLTDFFFDQPRAMNALKQDLQKAGAEIQVSEKSIFVRLSTPQQQQALEQHLKNVKPNQYRLTINQKGREITKGSLSVERVEAVKRNSEITGSAIIVGSPVSAVHESLTDFFFDQPSALDALKRDLQKAGAKLEVVR